MCIIIIVIIIIVVIIFIFYYYCYCYKYPTQDASHHLYFTSVDISLSLSGDKRFSFLNVSGVLLFSEMFMQRIPDKFHLPVSDTCDKEKSTFAVCSHILPFL